MPSINLFKHYLNFKNFFLIIAKNLSPSQPLSELRKRASNISSLTANSSSSLNLSLSGSGGSSATNMSVTSPTTIAQQFTLLQTQQLNQPQSPQPTQIQYSVPSPQPPQQPQQTQPQQQQQSVNIIKQISQQPKRTSTLQFQPQQQQSQQPPQIQQIIAVPAQTNTLQQQTTKLIPTLMTKPAGTESNTPQQSSAGQQHVANKPTGPILIRQTQQGQVTTHLSTKSTTIATALGLNQSHSNLTTTMRPQVTGNPTSNASVESLIKCQQINKSQQQTKQQPAISSVSLTSLNSSTTTSATNPITSKIWL